MKPVATMQQSIASSAKSDLVELRRELHKDPEVGLDLPKTQGRVLEALRGLDLEITTGQNATSVVAILRGGAASAARGGPPVVLLRGDMDALPIVEQTGLSFASRNGAMHACGHDMHTAGLVGAAKVLAGVREQLDGDVIFMFQPGEEGHNGAQVMIDEGVLDAAGSRPVGAYGVHMASDAPAGLFTTRAGSYMASFCQLDVTIHGRGGHGSRPYQTLDPIQLAAELIGSMQTFITRRFNAFDPVVLTVGSFHGGNTANIVPDNAAFQAGIRCFSPAAEDQLEKDLPRLIEGIAQAHQLRAEVKFERKLPATINNAEHADFWAATAGSLFGENRFETLPHPKAGSEDFSRVLMEVPGAYGHLGAGSPDIDPNEWAPLHSARAVYDDRILPDHALFLATLAQRRLHLAAQTPTH
ncbi:M20 metallopeptidase family protein [Arthrobacter roseus]|uniref:M20 metallopeptidase family protein n=1 Tax=Arthrobacter roseus TaxID=136274 RepID=UPI00196236D9|nr:M20 family metallopeptidase [Arthrobacter roseus]MBM7847863.1 hippurate hydrolase [Arthrobacter roseus]